MTCTLNFDMYGGYEGMTGAWTVDDPNGNTLVTIDQADFGQKSCDYDFRSAEAERIACIVFKALQGAPDVV